MERERTSRDSGHGRVGRPDIRVVRGGGIRRRGAVGEAIRRTSRRKRRSCLQSTEIPYDLFRLSRRSRCLCCYRCLFPRSGRGWLVHLGIEGGSRPLMRRQPRSRDTARRERGDQSQSGNAPGEAQPSADVGGLPCRDDGGLGGLGGHTRTRRVRRPGPCRESAGGRLSWCGRARGPFGRPRLSGATVGGTRERIIQYSVEWWGTFSRAQPRGPPPSPTSDERPNRGATVSRFY